jgi:hypothetical protein
MLYCSDHGADIYGIVAHPERPFTFVSCSRDTTVRVFELDGMYKNIFSFLFVCSKLHVYAYGVFYNTTHCFILF